MIHISKKNRVKRLAIRNMLLLILFLAAVTAVAGARTGAFYIPYLSEALRSGPESGTGSGMETGTETGTGTAEAEILASSENLRVHFLDMGQSDATLITCGGHAMLFDTGDGNHETALQEYLQAQGVEKLDYVIGAHLDEDHIGGMDVILTEFDCGTVIMPEYEMDTLAYWDVIAAMKHRRYQNTPPVVGDKYRLGEAEFTVIAPNRDYGDDSNNWSVGILLQYGDRRFLFTGDAEADAEADMINNGIDISCDVYQAGHHGSYTSSSAAFLDTARPEYAVISCGKDNLFGHPHGSVLRRFKRRGIRVFRTDEQGTIIAESDGEKVTFNCEPSVTWKAGKRPDTAAWGDGKTTWEGEK